jgi:aryl-alcohol dehydrogenase
MKITAAVVNQAGEEFSLEECELGLPQAGEVLLKIEACGICHTDIAARDQHIAIPLPAVLGHEGVGRIVQIGANVTEFTVGDRVLVSFGSCGQCPNCVNQAPGYCHFGATYIMQGRRLDGSSPIKLRGESITGHFFAQSSMATHAIASVQNMVKIPETLAAEVAAPLACGVQTGVGSVMLAIGAEAGKSIAVLGCGTVGLAAIMAAKIVGCSPIIAIDLNVSRLALATELGATHTINGDVANLSKALQKLGGLDYALDTTGVPAVAESAFNALKSQGTLACVGVGKPGAELKLDFNMLMFTGRRVRGVIEGDAVPREFIPKLIQYHAEGRLPIEKLVATYAFEQINDAVRDSISGAIVKPVLLMS